MCIGVDDPNRRSALDELNAGIAQIKVACQFMGLDCVDLVNRVFDKIMLNPDPTAAHHLIDEIQHAVVKELSQRECFLLTEEESRLHQWTVPASIVSAFPESVSDLVDALGCLIFGRSKAAVFHSMNALEPPLRATAKYFGIQFSNSTMWGTAIGNIQDKIESIGRTKKTNKAKANDALQFYGEAAKEFSYFKDAWRNHVMHQRGAYDQETAKSIFNHTVAFTEHLSQRLSSKSRKRYF